MRSAAAAIAAPQDNASTTATTCFTPGSPREPTIIPGTGSRHEDTKARRQSCTNDSSCLRVFVAPLSPRQEASHPLEEGLWGFGLDGGGGGRRAGAFELLAAAADRRRDPIDAGRVAEHDAPERLDADLEQRAVGHRGHRRAA